MGWIVLEGFRASPVSLCCEYSKGQWEKSKWLHVGGCILPLSLGVMGPLLSSGEEKSYAKIRYSRWMLLRGALKSVAGICRPLTRKLLVSTVAPGVTLNRCFL